MVNMFFLIHKDGCKWIILVIPNYHAISILLLRHKVNHLASCTFISFSPAPTLTFIEPASPLSARCKICSKPVTQPSAIQNGPELMCAPLWLSRPGVKNITHRPDQLLSEAENKAFSANKSPWANLIMYKHTHRALAVSKFCETKRSPGIYDCFLRSFLDHATVHGSVIRSHKQRRETLDTRQTAT